MTLKLYFLLHIGVKKNKNHKIFHDWGRPPALRLGGSTNRTPVSVFYRDIPGAAAIISSETPGAYFSKFFTNNPARYFDFSS